MEGVSAHSTVLLITFQCVASAIAARLGILGRYPVLLTSGAVASVRSVPWTVWFQNAPGKVPLRQPNPVSSSGTSISPASNGTGSSTSAMHPMTAKQEPTIKAENARRLDMTDLLKDEQVKHL